MPLPDHVRQLIAQSISQSIAMMGYRIQDPDLQRMADQIEEVLEAGGYVVLSQDELTRRIEDGSDAENYEDGQ